MKPLFSTSTIGYHPDLAFVRIIVGLFMVYHGWEVFDEEKMKEYLTWDPFQNSPAQLMVYAGKLSELIGGSLLVLGFLTRIATLLITGTMLYISLFVGSGKIWCEDQHPFLFVLLGLIFFFTGPGRHSLDHLVFTKTNNRHR
jgi:uncharacterized membrane protein YphA (DoxX/SURF4 family)